MSSSSPTFCEKQVAVCCFSYGTATMYSKGKQKWRKLYKDLESMNRELDIQQSIDDAKAAAVRFLNLKLKRF